MAGSHHTSARKKRTAPPCDPPPYRSRRTKRRAHSEMEHASSGAKSNDAQPLSKAPKLMQNVPLKQSKEVQRHPVKLSLEADAVRGSVQHIQDSLPQYIEANVEYRMALIPEKDYMDLVRDILEMYKDNQEQNCKQEATDRVHKAHKDHYQLTIKKRDSEISNLKTALDDSKMELGWCYGEIDRLELENLAVAMRAGAELDLADQAIGVAQEAMDRLTEEKAVSARFAKKAMKLVEKEKAKKEAALREVSKLKAALAKKEQSVEEAFWV